jgi:hypothetical protein
MCLKDDDTPSDLLPSKSSSGTVRPIMGPEIYQGHGLERISSIIMQKGCRLQRQITNNRASRMTLMKHVLSIRRDEKKVMKCFEDWRSD